jgi:hypothetical protein
MTSSTTILAGSSTFDLQISLIQYLANSWPVPRPHLPTLIHEPFSELFKRWHCRCHE